MEDDERARHAAAMPRAQENAFERGRPVAGPTHTIANRSG
jgi:hypothetical protein